jgi:rod shape-determining protein MreC
MLSIPSRHRSLALFTAVIAAQVLLLAVQIRHGQQARLVRVWAIESVSPLGRGAAWSVDGARGLWNNYVALRHLREENDQLTSEVGTLKIRNAQLESRSAEADRLAALLGFRDGHTEVQMLAARVIGASPDPSSHLVFISRGSRDGVKRDMGVITPEGVVGKVFAAYPDTSQVLLLTDKESGVGALLGESRAQGPVRGTGGPLLGLEYISNEVKVEAGEKILTSGQDRIFPKDLPVGTVMQAQPEHHGPFQKITVKPAARLDGLEEVLVLLTRQEFVFRKDADKKEADKSVPLPVAIAAADKTAAPVTAVKAAAPVLPAKPVPVAAPKPAAPVAPPKPPAPAAQPKPPVPVTQPEPETTATSPDSETPNNP